MSAAAETDSKRASFALILRPFRKFTANFAPNGPKSLLEFTILGNSG
jgi:hypothetical protein